MTVTYGGDTSSESTPARNSIFVGANEAGSLLVDGGAVERLGSATAATNVEIGSVAGASGTVTVDGIGSRLDVVAGEYRDPQFDVVEGNSASVIIGAEGVGRVTVTDGGALTVVNRAPYDLFSPLILKTEIVLGRGAGSTGVLRVDGGSVDVRGYSTSIEIGGRGPFYDPLGGTGRLVVNDGTVRLDTRNGAVDAFSSFAGITVGRRDVDLDEEIVTPGLLRVSNGSRLEVYGYKNDGTAGVGIEAGRLLLEDSDLVVSADDAYLAAVGPSSIIMRGSNANILGGGGLGDGASLGIRGTYIPFFGPSPPQLDLGSRAFMLVDVDSTLLLRTTEQPDSDLGDASVLFSIWHGTFVNDGTVQLQSLNDNALFYVGLALVSDRQSGTLVQTPSLSTARFGDGSLTTVYAGGPITSNSSLALFQIGLFGNHGRLFVEGGDVRVTSQNGLATFDVGATNGSGIPAGTGEAYLSDGSTVTVTGEKSRLFVAGFNESDGTLVASGGSKIHVRDRGEGTDASVEIGTGILSTGRMTITGTGTTLSTELILVGEAVYTNTSGSGVLNATNGGRIFTDALRVGEGGALNTKGAVLDFLAHTADERDLLVDGGMHRVLTGVTTIEGNATYQDGGTLAFQVAPGSNASGRVRLVGEESAITFGTGSRLVIEAAGGADFRGGETYALIVRANDALPSVVFGGDIGVSDIALVTGQSGPGEFGYAFNIDASGTFLFRALNDGEGARNAVLRIGATSNDVATFDYDTDAREGYGEGGFLNEFFATNLDAASGTAGADVLTATGRGDLDLFAQAGDDRVTGSNGANRIFGQAGDDALDGQAGDDRLFGGAGDDVLAGNLGTDLLFGQAGADVFVYSSAAESAVGAGDLIVRFERGADTIDLSAIDGGAAPGDQPLAFIGTSAFTGTGGEVRVVAGGVIVDVDGDRGADMVIRTPGAGILAADDFVL